ncbi:MAG TPA: VanZ family protein [Flavobacterium sp.]|jgi:VanZ family protein|uniref:VanZ family protein n=1 Tax=Flavobacterium sp. TaxID=239 RepID=UPI002CD08A33|nr:VanZ family protein [Flavobacterium sp.]MCA0349181.1 VanZ family protein [Bacteroidota bacterium]HPW98074.1 VanZ family protein [Flavobacterium sp.]HQA74137.1 VanZ family protein [Flavobacterium sp.]
MIIKNLLALKTFWLVTAVFWTSTILFLCLIDSSELPSLSIKMEGTDKGVHFTFHFIFTLLWSMYVYSLTKNINRKKILKVLIASFLFGVLIEIFQGCFTTTRQADVMDVLANTIGAISAGILIYFILKRIKKLKT